MNFDMKIVCLVIFIGYNYFQIIFIHTFQPIKNFIQNIYLIPVIIQKIHPCTCGKIFSHVILTWHGDILKMFYTCEQNIPKRVVHVHKLKLTLMCSLRSVIACFYEDAKNELIVHTNIIIGEQIVSEKHFNTSKG